MKLYRYRSLENIEYTFDILLNERLYCAPFNELNDPFEGLFIYVTQTGGLNNLGMGKQEPSVLQALACGYERSEGGVWSLKTPRTVSDVPMMGGTRICSLSESLKEVRLWSHYSDGHKGVAIEIDFTDKYEMLHKVDYVDQLKESIVSMLSPNGTHDFLGVKTKHWEYEDEYRIITDEKFYDIKGRVTAVYLGLRTSDLMRELLIRSIPPDIPIYSTKLNEQTIDIEIDKRLN